MSSGEGQDGGSLTEPEIDAVVEVYRREMARFEEAALSIERRLRQELRAQAVRCLLSSRAKHPDDLREKLSRKSRKADSKYTFEGLQNVGAVVTDLAGVRVLAYQWSDAEKARHVVTGALGLAGVPCDDERKDFPLGYRGLHLLVRVPTSDERASLRGTICEVQITTIGQHIFNELEHDVGYKDHGVAAGQAERDALQELWSAAQIVDKNAGRLLVERGENVIRSQRVLSAAAELRFVLETGAGRPLSGDFELLFRFLRSSVQNLTATQVGLLGLADVQGLVDDGALVAQRGGWRDPDDVGKIIAALYATNRDELNALAAKPDKPDWFRQAVEAAARALGGGG